MFRQLSRQVTRLPVVPLRARYLNTGRGHRSVFPASLARSDMELDHDKKLLYLESIGNKELLSYFFIGLATYNAATLKLAIKAFPYLPMSLVNVFVASVYCGGETTKDVLVTGDKLTKRLIYNMMLSYTVEDSEGTKNIDINNIVEETIKSVDEVLVPHTLKVIQDNVDAGGDVNDMPAGYVALKPSALVSNPAGVMKNYKDPEYKQQWEELVENCSKIVGYIYKRNQELQSRFPERTIPLLVGVIDAEKYELQQAVYELQRILAQKFNPVDRPVSVIGTIQMYLKQSYAVLESETARAATGGYKIGMKLVRGAYIHSEKNRKDIIHDTKEDTDINYNKGVKLAIESILANKQSSFGHLVVASHNRNSLFNATGLLAKYQDNSMRRNITLAQLLGMADDITYDLVKNHGVKNLIKYVPWGPPVETRDYLARRLEENGDSVRDNNGWALVKAAGKVLFSRVF